jgi:hypothetical protein
MDQGPNPYTPGWGIKPLKLAGSRLLLEFETLAREAGWACNDVEEVGSRDFRQTFA